jgi:hypothetical protein
VNATETAALLAVTATYDGRTFSEPEVTAWHRALADLPFEDCRDAVIAHYTRETAWLMPAHVRRLVGAARNDRAMRALPEAERGLTPMPSSFRTNYQQSRQQNTGSYPRKGNLAVDRLADQFAACKREDPR